LLGGALASIVLGLGGDACNDSSCCGARFALSRWRLARDGREHPEYGIGHGRDRLWAYRSAATQSKMLNLRLPVLRRGFRYGWCVVNFIPTMVERNIAIAGCHSCHAWGTCLDWTGRSIITVAALTFIFQTRPDLRVRILNLQKAAAGWIWAGGLITLVVVLLSPWLR